MHKNKQLEKAEGLRSSAYPLAVEKQGEIYSHIIDRGILSPTVARGLYSGHRRSQGLVAAVSQCTPDQGVQNCRKTPLQQRAKRLDLPPCTHCADLQAAVGNLVDEDELITYVANGLQTAYILPGPVDPLLNEFPAVDTMDFQEAEATSDLLLLGRVAVERRFCPHAVQEVIFKARLFGPSLKIEFLKLNCFLFHFESSDERDRTLSRGPWNIRGHFLVLKKSPAGMAFWIHLHGVPLCGSNPDVLRRIGATVRKVVECNFPLSRMLVCTNYPCLRVELDTRLPLPTGFSLPRQYLPPTWIDFC
ncbi:hypothetical protein CJ030_MR7G016940 [Morella rubra]|uniref:DUF4283 domain-containing protein n=1 Tax=Morella rubra TaxID=262757 RepID=A0A6A1V3Z8_9ROSI|nr:hypothetical protein CJ030_MR7G016940 [Morella rubra]